MIHKTVLLKESIDNLNLAEGKIFFDGTLGGAGHTSLVCSSFDGKVEVIATDRDSGAIENAEQKLSKLGCEYHLELSDYRNIDTVLATLRIPKVDAILIDLGLSSDQLDVSGRGFTFKNNEPLLMTFATHPENIVTAQTIVNDWGEETIADILYAYADERFSRRIAKAIIQARAKKEIETTGDLVAIIENAVPAGYRKGKIHPATKTFQALRIAVNDEISALKEGMSKGWELLNSGGRMAIISFHSVEDREVKNFFRDKAKEKLGKLINKKPMIPSDEEIQENPRARSAKLRVIEKI
jgi:16S rRNA (cytosine1402-N4)-methyltransferase